MLYAEQVSEDVTVVSGFYEGPTIAQCADVAVKTPLAIGTAADYFGGEYGNNYPMSREGIANATKAGWMLVRWGWTVHGSYRVLLLARRFPNQPVAYARDPYWALGCSCNANSGLEYRRALPANPDRVGSATLAVYHGKPLDAAAWKTARERGWHRILRSNILAWGYKPSQLPVDLQKAYGVGKFRERA